MKCTKLMKSLLCLVLVAVMSILPLTAMAASNAYILKVTADKARLRDGYTSSSSVITKLSKGAKVLYWGTKSKYFCKVATVNGKVGWVYRNYLSNYGAVKKSQVYVTNKATTVYKKSGSKLKKYTTVSANRYLLVVAQNSGWSYVRTVTGKAGYVKSSALSKAF